MPENLRRGELWRANYGTAKRPDRITVLIVSSDEFLAIRADTVIVVPVRASKRWIDHYPVWPCPCGGVLVAEEKLT